MAEIQFRDIEDLIVEVVKLFERRKAEVKARVLCWS